jgi:broad specificity phosphatase PhoE
MEHPHPSQVRRWMSETGPHIIFIFLLVSCAHSVSTRHTPGLTVYFTRHAETVANVTGEKTPENLNTFTEQGLEEIETLTEALKNLPIDAVLVSPTLRTEHTVLPFLKQRNIQAEIWPELEEWHMEADPESMQVAAEEQLIAINPEEAPYFRLRDAQANKRIIAKTYEGGMSQTHEAARLIIERFGHTDKTILIIGHSNSGSRLLEVLMRLDPVVRFKLEKARLAELVQNSKGKFTMRLLNGKPYSNEKPD